MWKTSNARHVATCTPEDRRSSAPDVWRRGDVASPKCWTCWGGSFGGIAYTPLRPLRLQSTATLSNVASTLRKVSERLKITKLKIPVFFWDMVTCQKKEEDKLNQWQMRKWYKSWMKHKIIKYRSVRKKNTRKLEKKPQKSAFIHLAFKIMFFLYIV